MTITLKYWYKIITIILYLYRNQNRIQRLISNSISPPIIPKIKY